MRPRTRCTISAPMQDGLRLPFRLCNWIAAGRAAASCVQLRRCARRREMLRDMDVLTGFAAPLSRKGDEPCLIKLLEHLGQDRGRAANKLRKTVAKHRKAASRGLKDCAWFIEKNFDKHNSAKLKEWPIDATADALRISGELWPGPGSLPKTCTLFASR